MIDETTKKPLTVSIEGDAGPYIMVPVEQLDEIRTLLDAHDIPYSVDAEAISLNGKPEITVINLERRANPDEIQKILDDAP